MSDSFMWEAGKAELLLCGGGSAVLYYLTDCCICMYYGHPVCVAGENNLRWRNMRPQSTYV